MCPLCVDGMYIFLNTTCKIYIQTIFCCCASITTVTFTSFAKPKIRRAMENKEVFLLHNICIPSWITNTLSTNKITITIIAKVTVNHLNRHENIYKGKITMSFLLDCYHNCNHHKHLPVPLQTAHILVF